MQEPGLDEHEWESEWQGLEGSVADAPLEALSELDDLIARMMEPRGFPVEEREAEVETEPETEPEPETVLELVEARRITQLADTGETVDPSDIGLAVQAYRTLYASLLELGPTSDARV